MSKIHLIRAEIKNRELEQWMSRQGLSDPDYAMHVVLAQTFDDSKLLKPFRVMPQDSQGNSTLYGYSERDAASLRTAHEKAKGKAGVEIMPAEPIGSKPMPSEWIPGTELEFETRVRPTRREPGYRGNKRIERDAYEASLNYHRKMGEQGTAAGADSGCWEQKALKGKSREEVYLEWLSQQVERHGNAEIETSRVTACKATKAVRKREQGGISGHDVTIKGTLRIRDAAGFNQLLARGIGRHRAYGYGMLLVRPATRQP